MKKTVTIESESPELLLRPPRLVDILYDILKKSDVPLTESEIMWKAKIQKTGNSNRCLKHLVNIGLIEKVRCPKCRVTFLYQVKKNGSDSKRRKKG